MKKEILENVFEVVGIDSENNDASVEVSEQLHFQYFWVIYIQFIHLYPECKIRFYSELSKVKCLLPDLSGLTTK